jgi:hypothetical protein
MKNFSIIAILLMFGLLAACETEIPFNGTETDPVLVVNCLPCTDSVIQANITSSRFFLSNENEFRVVSNATVALYVNGTFLENLTDLGQGMYRGQYVSKEGDAVRLNVSANGYLPVWTETTVPYKVSGYQIDSTITKSESTYIVVPFGWPIQYDTTGMTYSDIHEYKIHFSDVPAQSNYYRLIVKQSTSAMGFEFVSYLSDFDDIVFGTKKTNMDGMFTESKQDRYNVFSDELIDGKAHTITVKALNEHNSYYDRVDTTTYVHRVIIDLQSISKDYYLYLKSLKALEIADPFMSEPVQIYTNVHDGLGIVGARSNQQKVFVLPE